jgi:large subunit ribosomal protein L10
MAKSRAQKQETLTQLEKAFKAGKSVVFADYQGMTVPKVTQLRKNLHTAQVEYVVTKKTLLMLAAKNNGVTADLRSLPGMLGVAFAKEDEMAAAKIIGDAGKDAPIKLVGGIFDGKVVDQAYVITLSKLPSKAQLLAQLLSVFNGPMSGLARVLNGHKEKLEAGQTA